MTKRSLSIALVGPGLVGSAFLSQLNAYNKSNSGGLVLHLLAVMNSKKLIVNPTLSSWQTEFNASSIPADIETLRNLCAQNLPCILVDCTSSDFIPSHYPAFLEKGISIVTPNKKGFAGDLELYKRIKALDKRTVGQAPMVFHEATVGYDTLYLTI